MNIWICPIISRNILNLYNSLHKYKIQEEKKIKGRTVKQKWTNSEFDNLESSQPIQIAKDAKILRITAGNELWI